MITITAARCIYSAEKHGYNVNIEITEPILFLLSMF